MEEAINLPGFMRIKQSYEHERLARIDTPFYARPPRQNKGAEPSPSAKILNYVKGKITIAVDKIKKLFTGEPEQYQNLEDPNFGNMDFRDNINLSNMANSINQVMTYPKYQKLYSAYGNKPAEDKKPKFMNVIKFHKDVLINKIREKMEKERLTTIPFYTSCGIKPIPLKLKKNPIVFEKRHGRFFARHEDPTISDYREEDYNNQIKRPKKQPMEGHKRTEQRTRKHKTHILDMTPDLKKVSFPDFYVTPEKSSSSIIQYHSSGDSDEDIANISKPQKKLFVENKVVVQKRPSIQLKTSKKPQVNALEKIRLAKRANLQPATISKAEKFAIDEYSSFDIKGKLNENSFTSDHYVNDSKVETDSDESNIAYQHNQSFNVLNELKKMSRKNSLSLSSVSRKSENSIKDFNEHGSPIIENEVEEEKFEPVPSKKPSPKISFSPSSSEEFSQEVPQLPKPETNKPYLNITFAKEKEIETPLDNKPSSVETKEEPDQQKETIQEVEQPVKQIEIAQPEKVVISEPTIKPLNQLFTTPSQEQKVSESEPKENNILTPDKKKFGFTSEALSNPLFANIKLSKPTEPVNNPFLSSTPKVSQSLSDLVKQSPKNETSNAATDNKPVVGPFTPTAEPPKSSGLLAFVQSQKQTTPQITENTSTESQKPNYSSSLSWLNSGSQTNIFGNINSNNNTSNLLENKNTQQNNFSMFGNLNNNINTQNNQGASGGLAKLFENNPMNNTNAGNNLFGFNNNNNNDGMMSGNSGNNFLFGNNSNLNSGNSFQTLLNQTNINNNSSQNMGSNPFMSGGTNNSFGGSLFGDSSQMNNNPFLSGGNAGGYSATSGRKKNQKERAF